MSRQHPQQIRRCNKFAAFPIRFLWDHCAAAAVVIDTAGDHFCRRLTLIPTQLCGCQSGVSAIWHQNNTANYMTRLHIMGPLMLSMWDPTTAQSQHNPAGFRRSAWFCAAMMNVFSIILFFFCLFLFNEMSQGDVLKLIVLLNKPSQNKDIFN